MTVRTLTTWAQAYKIAQRLNAAGYPATTAGCFDYIYAIVARYGAGDPGAEDDIRRIIGEIIG